MRYISKPSEIEAIQWTGQNPGAVYRFVDDDVDNPRVRINWYDEAELLAGQDGAQGWVPLPVGHWIVRQPDDLSDHWPVDPDYFARKYERACSGCIEGDPTGCGVHDPTDGWCR